MHVFAFTLHERIHTAVMPMASFVHTKHPSVLYEPPLKNPAYVYMRGHRNECSCYIAVDVVSLISMSIANSTGTTISKRETTKLCGTPIVDPDKLVYNRYSSRQLLQKTMNEVEFDWTEMKCMKTNQLNVLNKRSESNTYLND